MVIWTSVGSAESLISGCSQHWKYLAMLSRRDKKNFDLSVTFLQKITLIHYG